MQKYHFYYYLNSSHRIIGSCCIGEQNLEKATRYGAARGGAFNKNLLGVD
jgi:hypothetical protein